MPGYCLVKRKVPGCEEPQVLCRFDYPMPLRQEAQVGVDSKGRVRFEPRRNDRLMNPYNPAMILAWRANIDLKPVLSKDAAINYIAKYASKAEKQAPRSLSSWLALRIRWRRMGQRSLPAKRC